MNAGKAIYQHGDIQLTVTVIKPDSANPRTARWVTWGREENPHWQRESTATRFGTVAHISKLTAI